MSYKEKPLLRLYKYENNSFVQIAIIDDYQEVSFENNLYEAGQFSITINFNIPNSQLFQRGLFVQFGNDSYDFGEISKVQDTIDENGKISQLRIISGYDARYILKRRVIRNLNSNGLWVMTGKGEIVLRNLIKDQCGSSAETKRQLPITNVIPAQADAIGKEFSASEQFTNLYEVCKTIATQSEIGWRISFIEGSLVLECYQGENKSQTIRFDTDYESLANGQFVDSSESFSNAIYVGGKGQNDSRDIYEGENAIEGNSPSGLDRFESWDNKSTMTIESEYEAEALSMLNQYGQTIQMQGNGLAKCPYIYKEQYNVGDIITVSFSGKSAVVQILSVIEHWSWGNYEIQFEFGKPQPNLDDQLQLILRKIQEASNKSESTESVKWYSMTANRTMDKKDVTYNTIGFTGTMTANRTFTFYLDNQKTGSKNYTIYVKNLSGDYTLTLTTGKSGATNVTIAPGDSIVKIHIDENGNIVGQKVSEAEHAQTADSATTATSATTSETSGLTDLVKGVYTGSGGQQNPQYVGKNRVRFNMMNTSVLSDTTYKDWLLMDCYSGFDVGGATAFGISRTQLRAYIMRANAGTSPDRPTSWAQSGEVPIISAKSWGSTPSGYVKLSNGLILQWGRNTASGWDRTISLNTSFTNGNTYVVMMIFDWGTATSQSGSDKCVRVYNKTASSFKSWIDGGSNIAWFAIGY